MGAENGTRSGALRAGWWVAVIALFSGLGGGVVFPILPMLGLQLGLSAAMVGLILAANRITRIFCNPLTGSLVDRFGARWPVSAGLFLSAVAVLAFNAALRSHSPGLWFIGGRVVWGIGSSLTVVGAMAAVMVIAEPSNRGRLVGRVRMTMALGMPAGMLLGGLIADRASPNAAFLTASILTLATAVAAMFVMPRGKAPARTKVDAGGHVWRELLRQPALQIIWCSNSLVFFAVAGVLLSTLVVLVHARGIHVAGLGSQGSAGLLMGLLMVFRAVGALGAGNLADHHGGRTRLLLPGAVACALGFAALALAQQAWGVALALMAVGLGSGALTIPLLALLSDAVAPQTQGRAMGIYQVYSDIGGSIGPILGLQLGAFVGYGPIYIGVACAMVLMIVPLHQLVRREKRHSWQGE
ncbi:MAG TPA: MFS transporter [Rhodanobacteraceae bacterium]